MRGTLAGRLVALFAATIVAVLALLGIVLHRTLQDQFLEELTESLEGRARAVRAALPPDSGALQDTVRSLGRELDLRITLIRTDGVVIADSTGDPAGFENHAGRPEVRAALAGRVGVASRLSESVGRPYRYVALPPRDGLIVRLALPLSIVQDRLRDVRVAVAGISLVAGVVGVGAVWLVSRAVTRPLRRMTADVGRMARGQLGARLREDGPAELSLLAVTLNRLAGELGSRIAQVGREREQLEQILSAMEEGVVLIGDGERIRYANPSARAMLGPGETLRRLAPAALLSLVDEAASSGAPMQRQIETGLPARTISTTAVPLRDAGGTLLVLRDVTAARRVEAMRRDFVADASHELKTPAAAIQATAETVERAIRDDPGAALRFAGQLRKEGERLGRIVSDLLDLSRLETERPRFVDVRLDRVALEEAGRLQDAFREAGVGLEVQAEEVRVSGAPKDLGLLVGNLLENAVRYTHRGGRVDLRVRREDGLAMMEVTDTGIGIPARDLPRIFERFYRVDRARSRETGGTGLGLSIARHVAEQHGGRIQARSELGRGSTFVVTLPLATPDGQPADR